MKDHIVGDQPLYGGDGGQIVFHIVFSGNQNPVCGEERPFFSILCDHNGAVVDKDALLQRGAAAELQDPSRRPADHGVGQVIVPVEDGQVIFSLMGEDVLLCQGIFFHGLMNIQMVGGQIGKNRNIRTGRERHQLERRELQNRDIVWRYAAGFREERFSNISSQMDGIAGILQHFGDEGGCGGLSVAASDSDDFTGTDLKKNLHFRG